MKNISELLLALREDGKWRKDALPAITLHVEARAPWRNVGTTTVDVESCWYPDNPWVTAERESEYMELLRLGGRCVGESIETGGVVQFGLNVYQDAVVLQGEARVRLCAEFNNTGIVALLRRLYDAHYLSLVGARISMRLPSPDFSILT
ncbi:MAG: hypothetical protein UX89_C0030G0004 [Parcubacteria group bacterium GW2011_GWA2_47_16]|nr:MAG: hypothetical protein UX89_C0030G0004 [Parcubacteria group bacterium GW2011_GWA2_47_16]